MSRGAKYWLGAGVLAVLVLGVLALVGAFAVDDETPTTRQMTSAARPTSTATVGDSTVSSTTTLLETSSSGGSSTSVAEGTAPTGTDTPSSTEGSTTTAAEANDRPTTTTTLPAADDPDAGAALDGPVELGQAIRLGDWQIGVSNVELDGTETILTYVEFNEPPAEGHQYLIVELSGVYLGGDFVQPVFDWALVKPGFSHVPEGLECGVVPNSLYDVPEVPRGEQFTANVCFEVPSSEVTEDLVLTLGLLDPAGRERFFALR